MSHRPFASEDENSAIRILTKRVYDLVVDHARLDETVNEATAAQTALQEERLKPKNVLDQLHRSTSRRRRTIIEITAHFQVASERGATITMESNHSQS